MGWLEFFAGLAGILFLLIALGMAAIKSLAEFMVGPSKTKRIIFAIGFAIIGCILMVIASGYFIERNETHIRLTTIDPESIDKISFRLANDTDAMPAKITAPGLLVQFVSSIGDAVTVDSFPEKECLDRLETYIFYLRSDLVATHLMFCPDIQKAGVYFYEIDRQLKPVGAGVFFSEKAYTLTSGLVTALSRKSFYSDRFGLSYEKKSIFINRAK